MHNTTLPRQNFDGLPLLLTVDQVCELVGSGRTRVYEWITSGQLESVKLGSSRRVRLAALVAFVEALSNDTEVA